MSISMQVGLISTVLSVAIAMFFGVMAPVFGGVPDYLVSWLIDFVMSVPHTILIILISLACGGGLRGVVAGVVCTHWTSLTRVIRAEVLQLKNAEYVQIAEKLGRSRWYIAVHHMFPAILPQLAVGAVLLFPHAILHEASITFLGFGLPAHEPAIGVILSESMKYLTVGKWWLALFPGISLVAVTVMVEAIGKSLEKLISPHAAHL
jgi:peptide/nickel transport system permease protein